MNGIDLSIWHLYQLKDFSETHRILKSINTEVPTYIYQVNSHSNG